MWEHDGYGMRLGECWQTVCNISHDDVIKWKHLPRYWPFVRGIHRSPVNSPHKGQWSRALMFSLICARISDWVNNREAGDLRCRRAHYDVTVMKWPMHRENNSPVSQITPEPTLLSWGGWPHEKIPPPPHTHTPSHDAKPSLIALIRPFRPHCSRTLWCHPLILVCHECQNCLRFHQILKMILEIAFSAHCTQICKFNQICMTIISKVARKCIWCWGQIQRCVTTPHWAHRLRYICWWNRPLFVR